MPGRVRCMNHHLTRNNTTNTTTTTPLRMSSPGGHAHTSGTAWRRVQSTQGMPLPSTGGPCGPGVGGASVVGAGTGVLSAAAR